MANDTDLLIRLLLDNQMSADLDKAAVSIEQRMKKAASVKEVDLLEREWKQVTDAIEEATKAAERQSAVYRAQAALLTNQVSQMRAQASELSKVSGMVGGASRAAGVFGGLIVGGAFAEVNRYVANAKEATAATRAWAAETEKLASARTRVDEVLAREALPMLRLAARFATQAAGIVERHPEIVNLALKGGSILIAVSALGSLAAKGIQMRSDSLYLASVPVQLEAAQLQAMAAKNQLIAAGMQAKVNGVSVPGTAGTAAAGAGGGTVAAITTALKVVLPAVLAGFLTDKAFDKIQGRDVQFKDYMTELKQIIALAAGGAGWATKGIAGAIPGGRDLSNLDTQWFQKVASALGLLGDKAEETAEDLENAAQAAEITGQVVSAWQKWKADDAQLIREAADNRKRIIEDAERQIADITRNYAAQRVAINKQFNDQRASIVTSYTQELQQAETQYATDRANIIRDSGEEIRQIEEQHQENIRKMTLEHDQRVEELTASRDALGLVKEERQFNQARAEAEREANQEIAQRKRETAQRLADLAQQYLLERAQKQQQFQLDLAENEQRRQEELKQAALAFQEEQRQAREARDRQLRDLQEALNAERLRRRQAFIAELQDINSGLLNERQLRLQYQNMMLQDAEKWAADFRDIINTALSTTAPAARAAGGYAGYGIYRLGDSASGGPGGAEYVLNASTTRSAERLIGGKLSQQAVLRAMMGGGRQITWNDNRRFDGRITMAERRAITEDTKAIIYQELGL